MISAHRLQGDTKTPKEARQKRKRNQKGLWNEEAARRAAAAAWGRGGERGSYTSATQITATAAKRQRVAAQCPVRAEYRKWAFGFCGENRQMKIKIVTNWLIRTVNQKKNIHPSGGLANEKLTRSTRSVTTFAAQSLLCPLGGLLSLPPCFGSFQRCWRSRAKHQEVLWSVSFKIIKNQNQSNYFFLFFF